MVSFFLKFNFLHVFSSIIYHLTIWLYISNKKKIERETNLLHLPMDDHPINYKQFKKKKTLIDNKFFSERLGELYIPIWDKQKND
jgi:hypothetical protein